MSVDGPERAIQDIHGYLTHAGVQETMASGTGIGIRGRVLQLVNDRDSWRRVAERLESEKVALREALIEAASAASEVHAVVIGSDCDEHDPALKAVIWAQRVEAAADVGLDATSGRIGGPDA